MSFTGKDVLKIVRPQVNDEDQTTWGDQDFLPFLNEGGRRLYNEHPESRIKTDGTMQAAWVDLADVNATVPLDDIYKNVLAEYLIFRFFDAEGDAHDETRAKEHEDRFFELIGEK